jgi:glycosyltransferase
MKISIITVCYNSEKYIRSAIESVLSQTYSDIEYIIVDGKSNDNTICIIKEYEQSFNGRMQWISEPDNGIYDAMNKGISMATGEIVGILNSDDLLFDHTVLAQISATFETHPAAAGIYGDLLYVRQSDISRVVRRWQSLPYFDSFFENAHVPPHPALYLKKTVYEQCGCFNTSMKLAADYEFMLRAMKRYRVPTAYVPLTIVKMRLGGATNKNAINILAGNREIRCAWTLNGFRMPPYFFIYKLFNRLRQFFV